jgi:hypothetical protein
MNLYFDFHKIYILNFKANASKECIEEIFKI